MSRYIDASPYEDCRIVRHKEDPGVKVKDIPTADVEEVRYGKRESNQLDSFRKYSLLELLRGEKKDGNCGGENDV